MTFSSAITICLKKYATFNGRAELPEFWYWTLFIWILFMAAFAVDASISGSATPQTGSMLASNLVTLATAIPTLAVSVRRLHDTDHSGWWVLLVFTVIGALPLLYWYLRPGAARPPDGTPMH